MKLGKGVNDSLVCNRPCIPLGILQPFGNVLLIVNVEIEVALGVVDSTTPAVPKIPVWTPLCPSSSERKLMARSINLILSPISCTTEYIGIYDVVLPDAHFETDFKLIAKCHGVVT